MPRLHYMWRGKKPSTDLHEQKLKTRKISKGCAFWVGFDKIIFTHPIGPNPKILRIRKPFLLKTRINYGGSATKIRNRTGNGPWEFKFEVEIRPEIVSWPFPCMHSKEKLSCKEVIWSAAIAARMRIDSPISNKKQQILM